MTLLKFMRSDGTAAGMLNWFPVHATSMNNSNTLISSDNKGLAAILFEKRMNPKGSSVGKVNLPLKNDLANSNRVHLLLLLHKPMRAMCHQT